MTPQKQKGDNSAKKKKRSLLVWGYVLALWLSKEGTVGTTISFTVHFFLLVCLALIVYKVPDLPQGLISGGFDSFEHGLDNGKGGVELEIVDNLSEIGDDISEDQDITNAAENVATNSLVDVENISSEITNALQNEPTTLNVGPAFDQTAFLTTEAMSSNLSSIYGLRGSAGRGMRDPNGTTDDSEKAVEAGLLWIAKHQDTDGGWNFDLGICGRRGNCGNAGTHASRTAATAVALLPFLGAGYTPLDKRPHGRVVDRGIRFLMDSKNGVESSVGVNLQQGEQGMYSQGLATIALCEAYGMIRGQAKDARSKQFEEKLRITAQNAIRYIEYAQGKSGNFHGGWRYKAGEMPGDISVSGWQAIALKSAQMAGLEVKSTTFTYLENFVNTTNYKGGNKQFQFNYLPIEYRNRDGIQEEGKYPDSTYSCTAIGLLLHMYLGRRPGVQSLDEGVSLLDHWGPFKSDEPTSSSSGRCNLYYAYYGTLVLHHYGGSAWSRWFPELREFLIKTQATRGHEQGSWFFKDPYCDVGGRLLSTSFAIMILEIRYRYMPLYE